MSSITLLIIGGGQGGFNLIKLFRDMPDVEIRAVVDKDLNAPGIRLAREQGIPVARDWKPFCRTAGLDILLNVTGNPAIHRELDECKPKTAEIIDGKSAHFMWTLVRECQRKENYQQKYLTARRALETLLPEAREMVANSPEMQHVKELIAKVAPMPTTVLLRGETGTGKEMAARAIHRASHLKDQPFVAINCTALTATLLESELFGYKKGAFTGAEEDRKGLLEEADGGTVFLDEIGDMDLNLQGKLLRFLQTGEIRPVGSARTRQVKTRIIAATNRDLEKAIERGQFRKDLFYRFNTFTIFLPPLRQRRTDIPYLAYHFLTKAEAKLNKRVREISDAAMEKLKHYPWPGNARELENVIERAVILCSGDLIQPEHLSLPGAPPVSLTETSENFQANRSKIVAGFEKDALLQYIKQAGGNISEASRISGIPRRTFYRLMKKHGL